MPRGIPNKRFDEAADTDDGEGVLIEDVAEMPTLFAPAEIVAERPVPEDQLSQDQLRIRELENALALERGKKDLEPEYEPVSVGADGNIVIHIVGEGFTVLGQNWYVGQELEFDPKGRAYKDTFDRRGRTWLSLAENEMAQVEKYGKVMFRSGPWPGKSYADNAGSPLQHPLRGMNGGTVMPPTQDELHAIARQESARGRRAPHLPTR